eukprot:TRINITY_DN28797_c0_g1_i1.p1 TRINITY_DN28797_c0_g1~~TRINITY_DN28797_c0_g1_i1.p1  ORF type:complete len:1451 (+),score=263.61 TRINITY_DN28797_c0_g1_i1:127-4353(+)
MPTPMATNRTESSLNSPVYAMHRRASSTRSLTLNQATALNHLDLTGSEENDGKTHDDGHDHGPKPPSILTAFAAGFINWLLMFGLCCAYGMILFSDEWHAQHRPLGVKMNLATASFVGLALSCFSGIPVAIGGPDLNPVVFLAGFVETIGEQIAKEIGLSYPSSGSRRLHDCGISNGVRCLAAATTEFCTGYHLASHPAECADYHSQFRPTVIFTVMVSSAILGLIFFCLGRFKLTNFVGCVPTSVMEAFLSCVGYKVFKYALKFCKFDPKQFCPAAFLGVLMYFLKSLHIGNPAVVIPLLILVPLAIFYAIVYGSGSDLEQVRSQKYMFPEMEDIEFWKVWSVWSELGKVNISAWLATLPDLVIMIIVCVLDCLLKLSGTENKLPVKVDKDKEMQLFGLCNILTVGTGSTVGYMQLKFNVIGFGVMGNATDRRGGICYAILCATGFFGTISLFNLQPRFFLSMLLFFAGSGFVAENLYGSGKYLTQREWMQVFIILGVFIFSEQLLYAVVVGGLLTCIDFILTYSKVSCLFGEPLRGGQIATYERFSPRLRRNLDHITDSWLLVVRLKGFLFFGSAQSLSRSVKSQIEAQMDMPLFRRMKYLVFDCKLLDGLDASASKAMTRLRAEAEASGVKVLWAASPHLLDNLQMRQILPEDALRFETLVEALRFVEGQALRYLQKMQDLWASMHPALALRRQLYESQTDFEPFSDVLTMDTMRHGCVWKFCSSLTLEKNSVLWEPECFGVGLFLLHSGAVGLFETLPEGGADTWGTPVAIYRAGWFLNLETLTRSRTQYFAVVLLEAEAVHWTEKQWFKMQTTRPHMTSAVSKAAMIQQRYESQLAKRTTDQDIATGATKTAACDDDICGYLQIAHILESFGFFEAPIHESEQDCHPALQSHTRTTSAIVPELTDHFVNDLQTAFATFSIAGQQDQCGETIPKEWVSTQHMDRVLHHSKVPQALRFAGIFNVVVGDGLGTFLTLPEFLLVGQQAIMAALSDPQIAKIKEVFDHHDMDLSGELDLAELDMVLTQTVYPAISMEEIGGINAFWDDDQSGKIGFDEFCKLVSRFVRHREQDWNILCACRELAGDSMATPESSLTAEALAQHSRCSLTTSRAEELLWAANWRCPESSLQIRDVLPMLMMDMQWRSVALPPQPPSKNHAKSGTELFDLYLTARTDSAPELRKAIANAVYDLRFPHVRELASFALHTSKHADEPETQPCEVTPLSPEEKPDTSEPSAIKTNKMIGVRKELHALLNKPNSSRVALVWSVFMLGTVIASLVMLVLDPLVPSMPKDFLFGFEVYITTVFSLEIALQLCVANVDGQGYLSYITSVSNICDVVASLPLYLELAFAMDSEELQLMRLNRFLRVSRVFRFVRLQKTESLAGPLVTVLAVIWGIFLHVGLDYVKKAK